MIFKYTIYMYILLKINNKIEGRGKQLRDNFTCKGIMMGMGNQLF